MWERSLGTVPPHFWLSAVPVYLTKVKYYQLGSSLCISNIIFCNALIESFIRLHQPQNLQVMFFLRSKGRKQHLEMGCNCQTNGVSTAITAAGETSDSSWEGVFGGPGFHLPGTESSRSRGSKAAEALSNGCHFLASHSTGKS